MTPIDDLRRILVVGAGLIGTSVGLALSGRGFAVALDDPDDSRVMLAGRLGAGRPWQSEPVDLVVIATPPAAVAPTVDRLAAALPGAVFTDVASVKAAVQRDVDATGQAARFVGGHPLAGRERSGAAAARADLFVGRPWVLTPSAASDPRALALARVGVEACGAVVVEMSAADHDDAVAAISHVPQLVASALAAALADAADGALGLAGSGLRDTIRIAGSDPQLWTAIVGANGAPVAAGLQVVAARLAEVAHALAADPATGADAVQRLIADGRRGRARLPGKHSGLPVPYVAVPVIVPDVPGELARLLGAAGDADINVEDLSVEHSPGRPLGVVELLVAPERAEALRAALTARGWSLAG